MTSKARKLTRFERRVIERVILGEKATPVVRDLDPACARPDVKASKILARPHVKDALAKMEADALVAAGITRVQIVRELGRIAFADPRRLFAENGEVRPLHELDADTAATIASVEVEEMFAGRGEERAQVGVMRKVKTWNKREALSELATIAGMKRGENQGGVPIGPGLTVIVQQAAQIGAQQVVQQRRVDVSLPKPA